MQLLKQAKLPTTEEKLNGSKVQTECNEDEIHLLIDDVLNEIAELPDVRKIVLDC